MDKKDPLRYVLFLFLFLGICFLSVAIYAFVSHRNFIASATKVEGRVINLHANRKGSKAPVVEYADANGKAHFYYHNVYTKPSAYNLGETVEVYFDPSNPEDATMGGFSVLTAVFGFLGFIFTLVSVICIKVFGVFGNQQAAFYQKHYR